MGIDFERGAGRRMSQPFRDLYHREAVCQEVAGGAVAEVVESHIGQIGVGKCVVVGLG